MLHWIPNNLREQYAFLLPYCIVSGVAHSCLLYALLFMRGQSHAPLTITIGAAHRQAKIVYCPLQKSIKNTRTMLVSNTPAATPSKSAQATKGSKALPPAKATTAKAVQPKPPTVTAPIPKKTEYGTCKLQATSGTSCQKRTYEKEICCFTRRKKTCRKESCRTTEECFATTKDCSSAKDYGARDTRRTYYIFGSR